MSLVWRPYILEQVLPLLLAAGCQHTGPTEAETSRAIEVLVTSDPETLDPRYVTDAVGMRVSRLIHAGLTRLDPESLLPVPYLAQSLVWKDARTLDVTLRKGLEFHSGAPFTADDVVATLAAFASPDVASRHASIVAPIAGVVALAPDLVEITLGRPHATLLSDLELPILRHDQARSPPDTHGLLDGLGPFEVAQQTRGSLVLSPAHYGALPEPRHSVVVRTVHDENARGLRLYSGRADVVVNAISPTLLPALEGRAGLSIASRPGANLTYLVVRVDRGPLESVRARRAISLAVDRTAITANLFSGRAQPADTVLPPGHWVLSSPGEPVTFDPTQARQLLADEPPSALHLTLLTSTDRLRLTVARTIAQELDDVGITLEVIPLELGTLIARLNAGDFDLASLQMPELTEPNTLRVFMHSASVPPMGSNRGRIADPELDRLLDLGDSTPDTPSRARVYADIEARIRQQLFIIPLWHEDQVAVVSDRARTFRPSREGRWLSLADLP
jgi:peptide/nickel transport system substrate-binding protein